jgi:hypothetical protein
MSNGELLRFDVDGGAAIVGTGFHPLVRDLEFGVDGALYLSVDTNQILRISAICAGDVDGDDVVGIGDFLLVLAQWGPCPPECLGDADGDGSVGILDLLLVLAEWGPCL